jgi:peptidoglycan/LPS O-acetylase OafA/YrhL
MAVSPTELQVAAGARPEPRTHIQFLDGIRGISALYVVLHHAWLESASCLPVGLHSALGFLSYGRFAVSVFIVLSGYVLMKPIAESKNGRFKHGNVGYFYRRSRRIVPPYYAALAVSIVLVWLARASHLHVSEFDVLTPSTVLSHLFLIHNLNMAWYQAIDAPMWSVATEFQIYFVFALILLPVWRRVGTVPVTICAFVLGLSPLLLGKLHLPTFFWASPWFLGLFGFGMLAACAEWSDRPADQNLRLPWAVICITALLAYSAIYTLKPAWAELHEWPMDTLAGLCAIGLMGHYARIAHKNAKSPLLMRLLQSRIALGLGVFSYSLYLMHLPVMAFIDKIAAAHLTGNALAAVIWCVSMPASIGASWALYIAIERYFQNK